MSGPVRIQRKRTKGWKMPEGAVYVGRPGKWGNPFKVGSHDRRTGGTMDAETAVERYLDLFVRGRLSVTEADARHELRGKSLACFCPLDKPCHADVLLEIANA